MELTPEQRRDYDRWRQEQITWEEHGYSRIGHTKFARSVIQHCMYWEQFALCLASEMDQIWSNISWRQDYSNGYLKVPNSIPPMQVVNKPFLYATVTHDMVGYHPEELCIKFSLANTGMAHEFIFTIDVFRGYHKDAFRDMVKGELERFMMSIITRSINEAFKRYAYETTAPKLFKSRTVEIIKNTSKRPGAFVWHKGILKRVTKLVDVDDLILNHLDRVNKRTVKLARLGDKVEFTGTESLPDRVVKAGVVEITHFRDNGLVGTSFDMHEFDDTNFNWIVQAKPENIPSTPNPISRGDQPQL